jgi:hypothetical protein
MKLGITAPSLNSSENCRRARRPGASFAMRDILSTWRMKSTKSDAMPSRD